MDALAHCIEAYANKNAHPIVDLYARRKIPVLNPLLPRLLPTGCLIVG